MVKQNHFIIIVKMFFLEVQLINHGGQNPLEAARYGCNILHGPNVSNFKEIYSFLKKNKFLTKINGINKMTKTLRNFFFKKRILNKN